MRHRVTTMIAVAVLLIVGAAPALASPGNGPGAHENHGGGRGASADHIVTRDAEVDSETSGPPSWANANAYGWRIIGAFDGHPYGHLQQCRRADGGPELAEASDGGEESEASGARAEACDFVDGLVFGDPGARAFWAANGQLLLAL